MGLSAGYYFGLTTAQLKALRALKGDPPRRQFVEGLKGSHNRGWRLQLGDSWCFLQHLFDPENYPAMPVGHYLCLGRSLHKGQFSRIELLPSANLGALTEVLSRVAEPAFRLLFFGTSEERFRHRYVPFWVAEEWQREGRTTVLTEERLGSLWSALQQVRTFLAKSHEDGRHVIFSCNFKTGSY